MLTLLNDFDRAFNAMDWALNRGHQRTFNRVKSTIDVDIIDDQSAYILEADLPGLSETDVALTLKDKILTIQAERTIDPREETTRRERKHLRIHRSFALPAHIQEDEMGAIMENGVLRITIPKTPDAGPKTIPVKAA